MDPFTPDRLSLAQACVFQASKIDSLLVPPSTCPMHRADQQASSLIQRETPWQLEEQGREARSGRFAAIVSSASGLWIFCRASSSAMLGQSIQGFTISVVHRSHYEEGPGKNIPFSVESKWRFLAMMTWFFGFGFAVPFLIVRHQPLKK